MLWPDIDYEPERHDPDGSPRPVGDFDQVAINEDLKQHYRTLIAIRNRHPALQLGDFETLVADDDRDLYGFSRSYRSETLWVILNNSNSALDLELPGASYNRFEDLLDRKVFSASGGRLDLHLAARWGVILKVS